VTDTFTQVQGKSLDLLLVVDDSGSMCGLQPDLADGLDALVRTLDLQEVDYHFVSHPRVPNRVNKGADVHINQQLKYC